MAVLVFNIFRGGKGSSSEVQSVTGPLMVSYGSFLLLLLLFDRGIWTDGALTWHITQQSALGSSKQEPTQSTEQWRTVDALTHRKPLNPSFLFIDLYIFFTVNYHWRWLCKWVVAVVVKQAAYCQLKPPSLGACSISKPLRYGCGVQILRLRKYVLKIGLQKYVLN